MSVTEKETRVFWRGNYREMDRVVGEKIMCDVVSFVYIFC